MNKYSEQGSANVFSSIMESNKSKRGKQMKDINFLLSKWEQILQKVKDNNGKVYPIEIGKKATMQEIEAKEKELGYQLPPSYKYFVTNLGKSLFFHYSFSDDTMIPNEFREIFSGQINWDFNFLQDLSIAADELIEDGQDYGRSLRGKLEFTQSDNGDIYAFDMSVEGEEKPVVYWEHEEDTVTYVADSFIDYLSKITDLGCIGSEKWQFDYFLSDSGLNTTSPKAVKWKHWLESFSETTLEAVKHNMEELLAFVLYRDKLDEETITIFKKFKQNELFQYLLEQLHKKEAMKDKFLICKIIGRVFGLNAEQWVRRLWEEKQEDLDARLKSYLTSMCLDKKEGLALVLHYLEHECNKKITGYDAFSHLGEFHSRDVISWMQNYVTFPVTNFWDKLFVWSNFSWEDVKRWTSLEEKHEVTVIHALKMYILEKEANHKYLHAIEGLPAKSEFIDFLVKLRDKQVLKKRIQLIEHVTQNIDLFY